MADNPYAVGLDDEDDDELPQSDAPLGGLTVNTPGYGGALQDSGGYMNVTDPTTGVPIPSMSGMTPEQLRNLPPEIASMLKRGMQYTDQGMTTSSALQQKALDAVAYKHKTLQDAYDTLISTKPDNTALLLALGSGLMAPTRTGNFGESLSNAGQAALPALNNRTALDEARKKQALEYRLGIAGTDSEAAKLGYADAQHTASLGQKMSHDALIVLQRNQDRIERAKQAQELAKLRSSLKTPPAPKTPPLSQAVRNAYGELGDEHIDASTGVAKTPQGRAAIQRYADKQTPDNLIGTTEDLEHFADEYGLPIVPQEQNPYRNAGNAARMQERQSKIAEPRLKEFNDKSQKMQDYAKRIERFDELNKRFPELTGPTVGSKTWEELRKKAVGQEQQAVIQEMESIATEVSRGQRQAGEGVMTEGDANAFEKMVSNVRNVPEANANIGAAYRARAQYQADHARFINDFYSINQHLGTAENAWREYAAANPVTVTDKAGSIALNPNRKSPADYFRNKNERTRAQRELSKEGAN